MRLAYTAFPPQGQVPNSLTTEGAENLCVLGNLRQFLREGQSPYAPEKPRTARAFFSGDSIPTCVLNIYHLSCTNIWGRKDNFSMNVYPYFTVEGIFDLYFAHTIFLIIKINVLDNSDSCF